MTLDSLWKIYDVQVSWVRYLDAKGVAVISTSAVILTALTAILASFTSMPAFDIWHSIPFLVGLLGNSIALIFAVLVVNPRTKPVFATGDKFVSSSSDFIYFHDIKSIPHSQVRGAFAENLILNVDNNSLLKSGIARQIGELANIAVTKSKWAKRSVWALVAANISVCVVGGIALLVL